MCAWAWDVGGGGAGHDEADSNDILSSDEQWRRWWSIHDRRTRTKVNCTVYANDIVLMTNVQSRVIIPSTQLRVDIGEMFNIPQFPLIYHRSQNSGHSDWSRVQWRYPGFRARGPHPDQTGPLHQVVELAHGGVPREVPDVRQQVLLLQAHLLHGLWLILLFLTWATHRASEALH